MKKLITMAVTVVALMIFGGLAAPNHAFTPVTTFEFDEGFDREYCLQECRSKYLGEPYGLQGRRGGRGNLERVRARMYFRCVQRCEREFWKEFDSETEE